MQSDLFHKGRASRTSVQSNDARSGRLSFGALLSARLRSSDDESDQAGAKQDKTGNGHGKEAVRSEFFAHGPPPIECPCPE
jgi:hypothetical protein